MALPLKIDAHTLAFTPQRHEIARSGFTPFGQERPPAALNLQAIQNGLTIFYFGKNFSPTDPPCL
jgi:hypothetical protein